MNEKEGSGRIDLRNVGNTSIEENRLYTTYKFYRDNVEMIKPYAKWNAARKCWEFRDVDALERIKKALVEAGIIKVAPDLQGAQKEKKKIEKGCKK